MLQIHRRAVTPGQHVYKEKMMVPSPAAIAAAEVAARTALTAKLGWESNMISDADLNAVVVEVLTAALATIPTPKASQHK